MDLTPFHHCLSLWPWESSSSSPTKLAIILSTTGWLFEVKWDNLCKHSAPCPAHGKHSQILALDFLIVIGDCDMKAYFKDFGMEQTRVRILTLITGCVIRNSWSNLISASPSSLVNRNTPVSPTRIVAKVEEIMCSKILCSQEAFNKCLGMGKTSSKQIAWKKWQGFFWAFRCVHFNNGLASWLCPKAIYQLL